MGIVTYALAIHRRNHWAGRHEGLTPALALLEESRRLGAGGIQVNLTKADLPDLAKLRECSREAGMHVEAIVSPPADDGDIDRFESDVRNAMAAGAGVARTVIMPGRRYEQFRSMEEFREFEKRGRESLERAEPVLARHKFRLAVENHKDQRTWEKLKMLEEIGSEYIGLCVDVGNNIPLMEDPLETVRAFAPWAFTAHLKDQAVRPAKDGFLLADVALGEGFLDLPATVKVLREAKPGIRFNFETITRDPLVVPVLTDEFWDSMRDTPAPALARVMRIVRDSSSPQPFPEVSKMPPDSQISLELQNVEKSIRYAAETLGL